MFDREDFRNRCEAVDSFVNDSGVKVAGVVIPKPIKTIVQKVKPCMDKCIGTEAESVMIQCEIDKENHKLGESLDGTTEILSRKFFNKMVKSTKFVNFYSRLTYFLRSKFFMKVRDRSLINLMVNDARIWMMKEDFKMESEEDFNILTQSVMAAFLVNGQELSFRQLLKNKINYDNMSHLNDTLNGNLGKTSIFNKMPEAPKPGVLFPMMKMPKSTISI
jgi:hypothetical protein